MPNCLTFLFVGSGVEAAAQDLQLKCDYFRKHGKQYHRQHIEQCLEKVDKEEEQKILAIIRCEKDCFFWRRLIFALGKHVWGQSVHKV